MQTAQQLLDAIPDGGSVDFPSFVKKAGSIASFLNFASPTLLSRKGQHVIVDCSKAGTLGAGGATISTDKRIEFDVSIAGNDTQLTNIKGISGHSGLFGGPVTKATVSVISDNRFRISGTVHVGFPVGDVDFTKDVDSQGNVLNATAPNGAQSRDDLMTANTCSTPSRTDASRAELGIAALCHLAGLFSSTIVCLGIPVFFALFSDSEFVRAQAREALNFQLSLFCWILISLLCCVLLVGVPMLFVVIVCAVIYPIIATFKVADGQVYRYPSMWFMRIFRPL